MDISVTELKHRCLEIVRRVEKTGEPIAITRYGRIVAHLMPVDVKPWEQLHGRAKWLAQPEESFVSGKDIKGL